MAHRSDSHKVSFLHGTSCRKWLVDPCEWREWKAENPKDESHKLLKENEIELIPRLWGSRWLLWYQACTIHCVGSPELKKIAHFVAQNRRVYA